ncbi:MAG TPA: hypothetical protein DCS09_14985 [Porphyromonadaceae bacterium]|nr:hypothetical protein [Porphyromonadaceae bacterium]
MVETYKYTKNLPFFQSFLLFLRARGEGYKNGKSRFYPALHSNRVKVSHRKTPHDKKNKNKKAGQ